MKTGKEALAQALREPLKLTRDYRDVPRKTITNEIPSWLEEVLFRKR